MKIGIPFAKPFLGKEECNAASKVILSGWVTQGPKVEQFENMFASYAGAKYACAVSSCTTALHLALLVVGVKPGDTVITVSHSFIATVNSIRHCQAEPLFVDIDINTYNMSVEHLKECLYKNCKVRQGKLFYRSRRVAAVLPVHQMGMPCDLESILHLTHNFNLPVVEDAACAIGSEIKINSKWEKIGKPHGDIACFSFHPRKVITIGEGGMLTTNNVKYDRLFRLLRHQGMSVSDRVRYNADKVIFEEYPITGYNYRMTDIQAAIGIEQIKKLPAIIKERRKIADIYFKNLKDIEWLRPPLEPSYCRTNWQSYAVRVMNNAPLTRNELMQYLLDSGISTRRGIMNAHQEKAYMPVVISLKNSELARDSVMLLPLFTGIKVGEIKKIIKLIKNV